MKFQCKIIGTSGLIMHNGAAGLDTRSKENREKADISRKKASNRTEEEDARLAELECMTSFWLNENGQPTIPPAALRACIEQAASQAQAGPAGAGRLDRR